jgi:hypothetical protein
LDELGMGIRNPAAEVEDHLADEVIFGFADVDAGLARLGMEGEDLFFWHRGSWMELILKK